MNARRFLIVLITGALLIVTSSSQAQSVPRLTLADAERMIDRAHQAATEMNVRVSIAVVDARGDLIALGRMPGAAAATPDTAIGKAMASAIYGRPSAALASQTTNALGQALNDASGARLRFVQGGVPIIRGGYIVGALAGSGATGQQDEEIARTGLGAL